MERLLFSIIVPVYNVEDYLEQCVNSIIAQEGIRDYEIILVDDGATDSSGRICDSFSGKYDFIKTFHKPNAGLSSARNYGVRRATGEYILFIDSDDYISNKALVECRKKIEKAEKCGKIVDVICAEGYYYDNNSRISKVELFDKNYIDSQNDGIWGSDDFLKITLGTACDWGAWGKYYRRAFWEDNGYEYVSGRNSEDMQLTYKVLIEASNICMVSAFVYYRYRIGSIAHSVSAKNVSDIISNLADWDHYFTNESVDAEIEHMLRTHLANTYIRSVLANVYNLDKQDRERVLVAVGTTKKWLKYVDGTEGKLTSFGMHFLGIRLTCIVLAFIKRGRIKKLRI